MVECCHDEHVSVLKGDLVDGARVCGEGGRAAKVGQLTGGEPREGVSV